MKKKSEFLKIQPENFIQSHQIQIKDNSFFCELCKKELSHNGKNSNIISHMETDAHRINFEKFNQQQKRMSQSDFEKLLVKTFISSNIPLHRLSNPILKSFLEITTGYDIPSEDTIRHSKILNEISKGYQLEIKNELADKPFVIQLDEMTDHINRFVTNIMVGELDSTKPTTMKLFKTCFSTLPTNAESTKILIHKTIHEFTGFYQLTRPVLLVTDGARYNISAGNELLKSYPTLRFVTCLAHGINRVFSKIQDECPDALRLITSTFSTFNKSVVRKNLFFLTVGSKPPKPVFTRWGTFIVTCKYFQEHKTKIFDFRDKLLLIKNNSRNKNIMNFNSIMNEMICWKQIQQVSELSMLNDKLTELQKNDLSFQQQATLFDDVGFIISSISSTKECDDFISSLEKKFQEIKKKNVGFQQLRQEFAKGTFPNCFNYAPLTTAEVERSFSSYKWIVSDLRTKLSETSIEAMMIIYDTEKKKK